MSVPEHYEIPSLTVGARKRADTEALAAELTALSKMDAPQLRAEWRRLFRSHPPKLLRRDLLQLGVAWKLQERVLGGLSAATKRQLDELARTMATKSDLAKARKVSLKLGARLVRAWGGETHEVLVVEDGFLWRGRTWRSLSVIAREMTGTQWSGPRFFGLSGTTTKSAAAAETEGHDHE
jgi:hypothetical protein